MSRRWVSAVVLVLAATVVAGCGVTAEGVPEVIPASAPLVPPTVTQEPATTTPHPAETAPPTLPARAR
ncbi:hypothetical protein GCM10023200_24180 [Actinomycetospora chlora]|uniref:Uncharacterized protein n=1 Tax=Actinomycetospora chlora TaxID=663608 RepID=A0ABP9B0W6_9PSEU